MLWPFCALVIWKIQLIFLNSTGLNCRVQFFFKYFQINLQSNYYNFPVSLLLPLFPKTTTWFLPSYHLQSADRIQVLILRDVIPPISVPSKSLLPLLPSNLPPPSIVVVSPWLEVKRKSLAYTHVCALLFGFCPNNNVIIPPRGWLFEICKLGRKCCFSLMLFQPFLELMSKRHGQTAWIGERSKGRQRSAKIIR